MQLNNALMARLLLNRYIKGNQQTFLSPLPAENAKAILETNTDLNDPLLLLKDPAQRLAEIHYTWLKTYVEEFPESVRTLLISVLPKKQSEQLAKAFELKVKPAALSSPVKSYLNGILLSKVTEGAEVKPLEFLPQSPLSPLAESSSLEIVEICDFLGLHDIGEELRQVVDQKILKNVYLCLNPKEQGYLRQCMQTKVKLAAPTLGLDRWNGDREKLRHAMQARGILRLGKALSGSPEDFLWHIVHKLDKGRGQTLMRHYSKKQVTGVTPLLTQQVQNIMNILKKKSES